ncbi:uncharacterized protein B0I36DRAFT_388216 [Microdochium trichocladiopsis]|uniref:F-box domain-containing protein n=1 Tax=Microdochium trichocladiopsis TaxID=1682393 RepID=A0A9P8XY39_9PEZI|nr:uncharacterized protein B0I36DRAFT_388216 [Microdochium trichocladiopsis]KAH7021542.1 hypothetical protein B0I36DRAFT_388216 [Microdochium trichocladiopsis]
MPPHLPDEIILIILSNLVPTDMQLSIRSLSCASRVSRLFRRIAEPLLYCHLHLPTRKVLETLCNRPELGDHVRVIDGHSGGLFWDERGAVKSLLHDQFRGLVRHKYCWPALDALLEHLIPPELDPDRDDKDMPYYFLDTACLTLTLFLTPHVEKLNVGMFPQETPDMLARLFELCGDRHPIRHEGGSGGDMMSRMPVPLSELRSLYLFVETLGPGHVYFDSANIRPLVLYPGLQTLDLSGMDWGGTGADTSSEANEADEEDEADRGDDDHNNSRLERTGIQTNQAVPGWPPTKYTFPGSHPNTKSLRLYDNYPTKPDGVREMLVAYPNLHTLVLEACEHEGKREPFDFTEYGTVLHNYARNLRRFEFEQENVSDADFEGHDRGAIGSLRDNWTRLEPLRMPLAALLGQDITEQPDLCDYLPVSLRWFWITMPDFENAQMYLNALDGMLDDRRLPRLEWVLVMLPEGSELLGGDELPDGDDGFGVEPSGFNLLGLGERHILCMRKSACVVHTPPGWEGARVESSVRLP